MSADDIDWAKPILAREMARGPRLSLTIPGPVPRYHLGEVRAEQIRRATILIEAAGGKALTPRTSASKVARLAAVVPGIRYRAGMFVMSRLAPTVPLLLADPHDYSHAGGRSGEWPPERLRKLLADVETLKAESVANLSDKAALKHVRNAMLDEKVARDEADRAAGNEPISRPIPEVARLANLLGQARTLAD